MTNLNNIPEPEDQIPNRNQWNSNEFGLQKRNLKELVLKNFLKVFGYNFIWDDVNSIWRAMRSDSNGNVKTVSGTQSNSAPFMTVKEVTNSQSVILNRNPLRSYFTIYNYGAVDNNPSVSVLISYPNPDNNATLELPSGYQMTENTWAGQVIAQAPSAVTSQSILVAEYY